MPVLEISRKVAHSHPKSPKKGRINVPKPEILAIQKAYVVGNSIRKIARETGRDKRTVSKIVKLPEFAASVEQIRQKVISQLLDKAFASVEYALEEELDGKAGWWLLERLGVIPSARK